MPYNRERYATDPEYRGRIRKKWREKHAKSPEKDRARWKRWNERLKNGEIELPELDWAICERGGSEAQAMAHRRRGQKPCWRCLRAETSACRKRQQRKRGA